jgi:uncharacterized damage-inducible protein DinB
MESAEVLVDGFERVREALHGAVEGLTTDQLAYQPSDGANSIAWLVWHLARVQDDHVADVAGEEQLWTGGGWVERFSLPFAPSETGYGQHAEEIAAVRAGADLLTGYYDAVHDRTLAYVRQLGADELDRIVDESWDPPVSLGRRLISVISDDLQHAGQAGYLRGLVERL